MAPKGDRTQGLVASDGAFTSEGSAHSDRSKIPLVYQHAIVRPGDLSRVDAAFFTANGFVSIALAACGIADVLAR